MLKASAEQQSAGRIADTPRSSATTRLQVPSGQTTGRPHQLTFITRVAGATRYKWCCCVPELTILRLEAGNHVPYAAVLQ